MRSSSGPSRASSVRSRCPSRQAARAPDLSRHPAPIIPSTSASTRVQSTVSARLRRKSPSSAPCRASISAIPSSLVGSSCGSGRSRKPHLGRTSQWPPQPTPKTPPPPWTLPVFDRRRSVHGVARHLHSHGCGLPDRVRGARARARAGRGRSGPAARQPERGADPSGRPRLRRRGGPAGGAGRGGRTSGASRSRTAGPAPSGGTSSRGASAGRGPARAGLSASPGARALPRCWPGPWSAAAAAAGWRPTGATTRAACATPARG